MGLNKNQIIGIVDVENQPAYGDMNEDIMGYITNNMITWVVWKCGYTPNIDMYIYIHRGIYIYIYVHITGIWCHFNGRMRLWAIDYWGTIFASLNPANIYACIYTTRESKSVHCLYFPIIVMTKARMRPELPISHKSNILMALLLLNILDIKVGSE